MRHQQYRGLASYSYAIGHTHFGGGIAGDNGYNNDDGLVFDYWDTNTTGTAWGCRHGTCPNVVGLTTQQFLAGLPVGFDPKIWGQPPKINNGYPYLLANPPQ
jgi:hypothetical protein